ncbi:BURP domain-containing protein 10-like [Panicum miliaceum]|uniref:BURP domain-containing protein 10-like n=1 Tax=Panicum miliaceum TaxID=4540 RepID=A0A3L6S1J3_PANMI|nr:BURP domain-containing protein 10-like [Panicum miliaceum]
MSLIPSQCPQRTSLTSPPCPCWCPSPRYIRGVHAQVRGVSTRASLDVPEEGIGSPSHIYKLAVVRAVTAHGANEEASNTVTCHSMSFPFSLFYCHAVNSTSIYKVTLHKDGDGVVPAMPRMPVVVQALAVCHVNTSGFDPTLNYRMKLGLKPGEASVCHFLTRGDVIWTPASVA